MSRLIISSLTLLLLAVSPGSDAVAQSYVEPGAIITFIGRGNDNSAPRRADLGEDRHGLRLRYVQNQIPYTEAAKAGGAIGLRLAVQNAHSNVNLVAVPCGIWGGPGDEPELIGLGYAEVPLPLDANPVDPRRLPVDQPVTVGLVPVGTAAAVPDSIITADRYADFERPARYACTLVFHLSGTTWDTPPVDDCWPIVSTHRECLASAPVTGLGTDGYLIGEVDGEWVRDWLVAWRNAR